MIKKSSKNKNTFNSLKSEMLNQDWVKSLSPEDKNRLVESLHIAEIMNIKGKKCVFPVLHMRSDGTIYNFSYNSFSENSPILKEINQTVKEKPFLNNHRVTIQKSVNGKYEFNFV
jgi:hypothetical protein